MRNEGIVELYAPRRTLIGRDGITKIPHFLQRLSSKCVLVVTDKGLIKVGTAGKVTAVLDNANIQYVVYDGVEPNPTTRIVSIRSTSAMRSSPSAAARRSMWQRP